MNHVRDGDFGDNVNLGDTPINFVFRKWAALGQLYLIILRFPSSEFVAFSKRPLQGLAGVWCT